MMAQACKTVLVLAILVAALAPLAAPAQQLEKLPRIGFLSLTA
jgi:hypothetical protein